MESALIKIVFVLVLIAAFFIWRRYRQQMIEQRLRDNPPERRIIEVSLPKDVKDSHQRMPRFYRKIATQVAMGSADDRKKGMRQLDIVYLVEVPGTEARLRFLIYSDPDKMDMVKKAIRQIFEGMARIIELDHDPVAQIAEQLKPPPEEVALEADDEDVPGISSRQEEQLKRIAEKIAQESE